MIAFLCATLKLNLEGYKTASGNQAYNHRSKATLDDAQGYKTASGNQASQHTLTITHQPKFDKRHAKFALHHAPYKASAHHAKLSEAEVREIP